MWIRLALSSRYTVLSRILGLIVALAGIFVLVVDFNSEFVGVEFGVIIFISMVFIVPTIRYDHVFHERGIAKSLFGFRYSYRDFSGLDSIKWNSAGGRQAYSYLILSFMDGKRYSIDTRVNNMALFRKTLLDRYAKSPFIMCGQSKIWIHS